MNAHVVLANEYGHIFRDNFLRMHMAESTMQKGGGKGLNLGSILSGVLDSSAAQVASIWQDYAMSVAGLARVNFVKTLDSKGANPDAVRQADWLMNQCKDCSKPSVKVMGDNRIILYWVTSDAIVDLEIDGSDTFCAYVSAGNSPPFVNEEISIRDLPRIKLLVTTQIRDTLNASSPKV